MYRVNEKRLKCRIDTFVSTNRRYAIAPDGTVVAAAATAAATAAAAAAAAASAVAASLSVVVIKRHRRVPGEGSYNVKKKRKIKPAYCCNVCLSNESQSYDLSVFQTFLFSASFLRFDKERFETAWSLLS